MYLHNDTPSSHSKNPITQLFFVLYTRYRLNNLLFDTFIKYYNKLCQMFNSEINFNFQLRAFKFPTFEVTKVRGV